MKVKKRINMGPHYATITNAFYFAKQKINTYYFAGWETYVMPF